MLVNSVLGYSGSRNYGIAQNNQKGNFRIVRNNTVMPKDTVEFKSNSNVIENLIVSDLRNYHYYLKDMDRFSSNLKRLGHAVSVYNSTENGITSYTVKNPELNSVIKIDINIRTDTADKIKPR